MNPNIKRISLTDKKISLIKVIEAKHIDILIYNFYIKKEIKELKKLKRTKIIYYNHSSYFYWIYQEIYNFQDSIYYEYKMSKYVISLIPLENDYLFKKWGINSILMKNPSTFEYYSVTPSDLMNKNIIMIGRGNDEFKRFDLGIKAKEGIIKDIPDCQMNIISFPESKYEIFFCINKKFKFRKKCKVCWISRKYRNIFKKFKLTHISLHCRSISYGIK